MGIRVEILAVWVRHLPSMSNLRSRSTRFRSSASDQGAPRVDLFEYQGKQFFAKFGMPVSPGEVAFTWDEAEGAAGRLGRRETGRASVHAGARRTAGEI